MWSRRSPNKSLANINEFTVIYRGALDRAMLRITFITCLRKAYYRLSALYALYLIGITAATFAYQMPVSINWDVYIPIYTHKSNVYKC